LPGYPSNELRKFSDSEVFLSSEDAKAVFVFFFPSSTPPTGELTMEQRKFAQGLLLEGIDASFKVGFVEALWSAAYGSSRETEAAKAIRTLCKEFARKALKHWWQHSNGEKLEDVRIYESVRVAVARNFRTEYEMMMQGVAQ
jgi:hypothetical protein